ncbi:MAG TPA: phage major capsid protein [Desulfatiglandales bacterium]|nr:phage major capsid protein [Desulfatiglandales bacterium]
METKEKIKKLAASIVRLEQQAMDQGRNLTREESGLISQMQGSIQELTKLLPQAALTKPGSNLGGSLRITGPKNGYGLINPNESKSYQNLFGNDAGLTWEGMGGTKDTGFFSAILSGRHHPGLKHNFQAAMTETVPSDGGFVIPTEYAERIHNVSLEDEVIMPNCYVQPMRSNEIKLPGMTIGDHSTGLMGGFVAAYVDEAGTINEHDPKVRQITLKCKKLTGLLRFSAELTEDAPGGEDTIINLCGKGLAWYRDKAFIRGTGAGEPLGILNAPCLIAVDKETGQKADTIIYENLTKMMASMYAGSFKKSIWIAHQSTIPSLLTLSLSVGTGGDHIPVMKESNGNFTMLTRPVIFTEKTEVLGDEGDIILADLSQYVVGLRSGMRFDTSIHVHFETDELLGRIIERHDGMPLWNESLTLADGSTEVSPFVTLAERV